MFVHTAPTVMYLLGRRLSVISFSSFFYLERGLNCNQLTVSIIVNAPGRMKRGAGAPPVLGPPPGGPAPSE
jgi:hypothetical protein